MNPLQTKSQDKLPKMQDLSPQQLAKEADQRKLKTQLKEKLWPFLELGCKDLSEAVNLLDVVKLGIEGAWAQKKGRSTLKSLNMGDGLLKTAPDYKKVKFLLDELQDETVNGAVNQLTSLKNLINDYGSKEISKQPMSTLKTYFDAEFKS